MKSRNHFVPLAILACVFACFVAATAQISKSSLQAVVETSVKTTLAKFAGKKLMESQLAITLIDLHDIEHPLTAGYRVAKT